jgi:uncharacterized protein with ParB-like and HNH nuclease domain
MSFQTPITIKEAIENIEQKKFLLPSIQREFVWKPEQIERLFDSIMKGYPVGSFLFWMVQGENVHKYQFYEFIRDFHEKDNRHNPKANITGLQSLTAILDGQQRLTSLYIGLKGSYAEKIPYRKWSSKKAFEKKELYLNLLNPSEKMDYRYDFRFLSNKELESFSDDYFWFRVGNILNFNDLHDIFKFIAENNITSTYASECLMMLYEQIIKTPIINYYLEKSEELDKVLNIFIRVNSGGTQLSYSDLLLSIATAQWEKEDARETITSFVDEINDIGDGFDFNKDLVLKACLVLCDFTDIAFKVDNFNSENMKKIEDEWENISNAIRISVELLSSFGFSNKTLTANYVLIPLAYYIYKKGNPDNFVFSSKFQKDRENMRKFTIVSLLKRIFGGQPDNVLKPLREIIKNNLDEFSFDIIKNNLKVTNKTLKIDDEELNDLLYTKYGNKYAFALLSLLYPTLDFRNIFHQDHIFPKSILKSRTKLKKLGLDDETIQFCLENYDYIGNIQLIEGVPNMEKSNMDFAKWLDKVCKTDQEKADYKKKHLIPDVVLDIKHFQEFLEKREELIIEKLKEVLG